MKRIIGQYLVAALLFWAGQNVVQATNVIRWSPTAASTDPTVGANWVGGVVPGPNDDVIISNSASYLPQLTGTAEYAGMRITAGGQYDVFGGTLKIDGGLTNVGNFWLDSGQVSIATVFDDVFLFAITGGTLTTKGFVGESGAQAVSISGGGMTVTNTCSMQENLTVISGGYVTNGATTMVNGTINGAGTFNLGNTTLTGTGCNLLPTAGANLLFGNLANGNGATAIFPANVTVGCHNAISGTGTFTVRGASFTFTETAATTIPVGAYTNLVLRNVGPFTLNPATSIAGNLDLGAATNGALILNENVTIGTLILTGVGQPAGTYGSTNSAAATRLAVFGGTNVVTTAISGATGLLVTLPGETFTSGSGNSGTAASETAGSPFNMKISAVAGSPGSYTLDPTFSGAKTVFYSGPANAPNNTAPTYLSNVSFTNGQAVVPVTLVDAQTTNLTAGASNVLNAATTPLMPGIASSALTIGGATPVAASSMVSASPASVRADNVTPSTVTVTLVDTYGNVVSGKTVTLVQTSGSGTPSVSAASGTSTSLGVVTFTVKSITPATDVFTATDSSDTVTVTQTASVTFTTAPPVATTMTVPRPAGLTAKISLADLATNWSDVYSYPVTLTGFSLTSTNGASVYSLNLTTNSGVITASSSSFLGYVNAANVNDQISYTISDGHGNTATGLINIVVSTSPLFGQASTVVPGGPTSTVNFAGQPGYTYTIERSTNLVTGTGWVPLETTNAPAAGPFSYVDHFTDLGGTPPGSAYYRLEWIP